MIWAWGVLKFEGVKCSGVEVLTKPRRYGWMTRGERQQTSASKAEVE
jgi:hypothetical protein